MASVVAMEATATFLKACSKSALMSKMFSIPTETLSKFGVTPAANCSAILNCWCVVADG